MTETEFTVVNDNSGVYYGNTYWNDLAVVRADINRRLTGDPARDWIDRFRASTADRRFSRALMLNCGNGHVERDLLGRGVIDAAVGIDCSTELLDEATAEAKAGGMRASYQRLDVNGADFPKGPYDLIVNFSAAHHIQRVDRVFRALWRLLDDDGIFVNYDYVGPHRNQYRWSSWEAAHIVNQSLPPYLRQQMRYPHLPTILADDPSEAIHPELALGTMGRYFAIEEFTPVGGAIAYLLLTHNAQIFAASPEDQMRWAEKIMAADGEYLASHPDDTLFAYWVARPRKGICAHRSQLERWAEEEDAREEAAAREGGEYYPHTSLQNLTLELAEQTILAEHRTAWAFDLREEVESLRRQLEEKRTAAPLIVDENPGAAGRLKQQARRLYQELGRRVGTALKRT